MSRLLASSAAVALLSTAAFAADLPLPVEPIEAAPVYAPLYDWTGFYVGVHAGYGFARTDTDTTLLPSPAAFGAAPFSQETDVDGFLGGGQVGFNWQAGAFVFGAEGDISWSGMDGQDTETPLSTAGGVPIPGWFQTVTTDINWFATARLRAGFTPAERLFAYATGGAAFAEVEHTTFTQFTPAPPFTYAGTSTETRVGWTIGGGLEYAFWDAWTLKAEYLYFDLGDDTVTANPLAPNPPFQVQSEHDLDGHIGRLGLNYRFGAPPAP